jgi:hypothetical protein
MGQQVLPRIKEFFVCVNIYGASPWTDKGLSKSVTATGANAVTNQNTRLFWKVKQKDEGMMATKFAFEYRRKFLCCRKHC